MGTTWVIQGYDYSMVEQKGLWVDICRTNNFFAAVKEFWKHRKSYGCVRIEYRGR